MAMCPLCNGLESQIYTCHTCMSILQDCGKTVDYLDNYSAYLDQDILMKVDGLMSNQSHQYCVHIFYCAACGEQTEKKVKLI